MTLRKWVYDNGGPRTVAPLIGVSYVSLSGYLRGVYCPSSRIALSIIRNSKGRVTLEHIVSLSKEKTPKKKHR